MLITVGDRRPFSDVGEEFCEESTDGEGCSVTHTLTYQRMKMMESL